MFQRPDMPVRFPSDRATIGRAEKFDEIYFRDVVDIAALKCFQLSAGAPVVYSGFTVACQLADLQSGQNIFVLGEQVGISEISLVFHHHQSLQLL